MYSPYAHGGYASTIGVDASSGSFGVLLSSGGSADTKTSWNELTSSAPQNLNGFYLLISGRTQTGTTDWLLDIGIGAAASEVSIIENIHVTTDANASVMVEVPIAIPAGTRVSVRGAAANTNYNVTVTILPKFTNSLMPMLGRATDYGTTLGTSSGTAIDTGGTANTKSAWVELTSSSTNNIRAMIINVGFSDNPAQTPATGWLFDIAVGAASSEEIVVADYSVYRSTSEIGEMLRVPIVVNIPSGTRISARAQSSNIDVTDRQVEINIIGLD